MIITKSAIFVKSIAIQLINTIIHLLKENTKEFDAPHAIVLLLTSHSMKITRGKICVLFTIYRHFCQYSF